MRSGTRRPQRSVGDRLEPSESPAWPLAVGVLVVVPGLPAAVRADGRLALALGSYRLGYYLLDLLEVPQPACQSVPSVSAGWAPVQDLAGRAGADALVVQFTGPAVLPGDVAESLTMLPLRLLFA